MNHAIAIVDDTMGDAIYLCKVFIKIDRGFRYRGVGIHVDDHPGHRLGAGINSKILCHGSIMS